MVRSVFGLEYSKFLGWFFGDLSINYEFIYSENMLCPPAPAVFHPFLTGTNESTISADVLFLFQRGIYFHK